jgi:hypothetical protein
MIEDILKDYTKGVMDSFSFIHVLVVIHKSPKIQETLLKSFVLNLALFSTSALLLLPLQRFFGVWLLYQILWVYPVYFISFVMNSFWYKDIAKETFRLLKCDPSTLSIDR